MFLDGELSSTGKGGGGRWVLVSHDPVEVEEALETVWREMSEVAAEEESSNSSRRFLHLKFEPMVCAFPPENLLHCGY